MKKTILLLVTMFLTYYQTTSQVLPVEDYSAYVLGTAAEDMPDDITYVKDVNNKLDKFTGIWKGVKDGISYEINVQKIITEADHIVNYKLDNLVMRYKVISALGVVLENTLDLEFESLYVPKGYYLDDEFNVYIFNYFGKESACGQLGQIDLQYDPNDGQLTMIKVPGPWIYRSSNCPNGKAEEILPHSLVYLAK